MDGHLIENVRHMAENDIISNREKTIKVHKTRCLAEQDSTGLADHNALVYPFAHDTHTGA